MRGTTAYDDLTLWLRYGPLHLLRAIDAGVPRERIEILEDLLVEAKERLEAAAASTAPATGPAPVAEAETDVSPAAA